MPKRHTPHFGKGGRPLRVPRHAERSAYGLLLRHLVEEGHQMQYLAAAWNVKRESIYNMFYKRVPLSPTHLREAAVHLKLDDFDTAELMLAGAIDVGYDINIERLLEGAP